MSADILKIPTSHLTVGKFLGSFIGRVYQRNRIPHNLTDNSAQQRVVGTAKHQSIHLSFLKLCQIAFCHLLCYSIIKPPLFRQRHKKRTSMTANLHVRC